MGKTKKAKGSATAPAAARVTTGGAQASVPAPAPLTAQERSDLNASVRVILDGLTHIRDVGERVGAELLKVKNSSPKLWREHRTFEDWTMHVLGMSRFNAYGLIRLAKVTANLADLLNIFNKRLTRYQADKLAQVKPEMQRLAYQIASAGGPADDAKIAAATDLVRQLEAGDPEALATAQAASEAVAAGPPGREQGKTPRRHRPPLEALKALVAGLEKKLQRPRVREEVPADVAARLLLAPLRVILEVADDGLAAQVGAELCRALELVNDRLPPVIGDRARHALPVYEGVLGEAIGHGAG